jgi:site-specific DNA recombinase
MELILIPFAPPLLPRKGVAHSPAQEESLSDASRTALLAAIARAKGWAELALTDPAFDFSALATEEKLSERYIRLLTPLAFLSPKVIDAIADGEAPTDLTPTALSRNLPLSWAEQERQLRLKP